LGRDLPKWKVHRLAVNSTKETAHAFIVRIWIETRELKDAEPIWRGVIEHIGSGKKVYFDHLEQIAIHIMPYIRALGVKVDDIN
jgi:hypothetical protein